MLEVEYYVQTKLDELRDGRLQERARTVSEVEALRPKRTSLRRVVGPRLVAVGSWLEGVGNAIDGRKPPVPEQPC